MCANSLCNSLCINFLFIIISLISSGIDKIILKDKKQRDLFLNETNSKGISTRPIWTLMSNLSIFKNAQCGELTNADWLEQRVVNIPSSPLSS